MLDLGFAHRRHCGHSAQIVWRWLADLLVHPRWASSHESGGWMSATILIHIGRCTCESRGERGVTVIPQWQAASEIVPGEKVCRCPHPDSAAAALPMPSRYAAAIPLPMPLAKPQVCRCLPAWSSTSPGPYPRRWPPPEWQSPGQLAEPWTPWAQDIDVAAVDNALARINKG